MSIESAVRIAALAQQPTATTPTVPALTSKPVESKESSSVKVEAPSGQAAAAYEGKGTLVNVTS